jgi:hypothetical protein
MWINRSSFGPDAYISDVKENGDLEFELKSLVGAGTQLRSLQVLRWTVGVDHVWTCLDRPHIPATRYPRLETDSIHIIEDLTLEYDESTPADSNGPWSIVQMMHMHAFQGGRIPTRERFLRYGQRTLVLDLEGIASGCFWYSSDSDTPAVLDVSPSGNGYIQVTLEVSREYGWRFQLPDGELSSTLPMTLGTVLELVFPEEINELVFFSDVPDGIHVSGRLLEDLASRSVRTTSGQRIDLRLTDEEWARIAHLVWEGPDSDLVLGEVYPYHPKIPGAAGVAKGHILLPKLSDIGGGSWIRTVSSESSARHHLVPIGFLLTMERNLLLSPGHSLSSGIQAQLVRFESLPTLDSGELSYYGFSSRNVRPYASGDNMATPWGALCIVRWTRISDGAVFDKPFTWSYTAQTLGSVFPEDFSDTVRELVSSSYGTSFSGTIDTSFYVSNGRRVYEVRVYEDLEPSGVLSVSFESSMSYWLGHSSAALWGFPVGTEASFRYDKVLSAHVLASELVPTVDPLWEHVLPYTSDYSVLQTVPDTMPPSLWHAYVDVKNGPNEHVTRSNLVILGGMDVLDSGVDVGQQWNLGNLVVPGPLSSMVYRVSEFTTGATDRVTSLRMEPVPSLVGTTAAEVWSSPREVSALRFTDQDFRLTTFVVGDTLLPQQTETLEAPYDSRYFPLAWTRNRWTVRSVLGLCVFTTDVISGALAWSAPTVPVWMQNGLGHQAQFVKNDRRYFVQMTTRATETRSERGGVAVEIGTGVPFSLLFQREGTPVDILGFPAEQLPFRTVHTNTALEPLRSLRVVSTEPGTGERRLFTKVTTAEVHDFEQGETVYFSNHRGSSNDEGVNVDEGHVVSVGDQDAPNVFYIGLVLERGGRGGEVRQRKIQRPFTLGGENYVYLCSVQLGSCWTTELGVRNMFAKCMLNAPPGSVLFSSYVSADRVYDEVEGALGRLEQVELEVLDSQGERYDFLNTDYSLSLEIEFLVFPARSSM